MTDGPLDRAPARPFRIATIPGDGVGPEVVAAARRVLDAAGDRFGFGIDWSEHAAGGSAIDAYGVAIRDEDVAACGAADAILLGAVGGPRWDDPKAPVRPEQALFKLRGTLGLYANLRPVDRPPGDRGLGRPGPRRAARGRRPADRPRADRRPLLRRSRRGHRRARRATRVRHAAVLGARDPARGPARVRARARPPPPAHQRRQGQRAGDLAPVADGRRGAAARVPGRGGRPPAGRFVRDAADQAAGLVRRPGDREPVRRHPVRRGRRPGRLARDAAVGVARRTQDGPRHVRAVRADPRLGARTSPARTGRTRSGRSCRRRCCCGCRSAVPDAAAAVEGGGDRRARRRLPDGRPRRRGRRATASAWSAPPRSPMPSSARWPPARRRACRHDRPDRRTRAPVILYDTTLRDGTQGENITLSLADKLRIARMLDEFGMPFIEGGWPGSNPKDIEFFATARTMRWETAKLAAFGSTRHRSQQARRRPEPARAGRRRDAGGDDLRQELAAPRHRGAGRHAGREPGHDRRLGGVRGRPGARGGLRRRALLRRLQGRPRLRARRRCGPPARRAPGPSSCATPTAAR